MTKQTDNASIPNPTPEPSNRRQASSGLRNIRRRKSTSGSRGPAGVLRVDLLLILFSAVLGGVIGAYVGGKGSNRALLKELFEKEFKHFTSTWENKFTNLQDAIAANAKAIAKNAEAIAKNAEAIAKNTEAIAFIKGRLVASVEGVESQVASNKAEILEKYEALENFVDDRNYKVWLIAANAEAVVGLDTPVCNTSPVKITKLGYKFLKDSGINNLLDRHDSEITKMAEERGVSDYYKLSASARYVVNNYEWGLETEPVDRFMLTHPEAPLFDIWQLAGIHFRDILMKKYGIDFPHVQSPEQEKPTQTEEKTPNPSN